MFTILSLLSSAVLGYFLLPVFSIFYLGSLFFFGIVIALVTGAIMLDARAEDAKPALFIGFGAVGVMFLAFLASTPIMHSNSYRNLIGSVKELQYNKETLPPIDIKNAPLVSHHMANQVAQKKLSEIPALGSQVQLGSMIKQKIGDHLYWVSFLEHSGFFTWYNTGFTPGYIKVSATDPADVQFVTELDGKKLQMKYLDSSWFGDYSARKIYMNGNKTVGITDITPEVDDNGRPYLTATLYEQKVGVMGSDAVGLALLDVQTGETTTYKLSEVPAWIDRVIPEAFVEEQINDWGEYVNGWLNPSNKGKVMISSHVDIVYGQDGNCYFYAGITSIGKDNGIIGFMLVNSRTKETTLHYLAGASEDVAAGTAVDVLPEKKYHATNPLPFSVNGVATYIMTLTDDNGIPRAYGMVSVENYQTLAVSDSLRSTYQAYLNKLSSHNLSANIDVNKDTLVKLEALVTRVNSETKNNNTNYYLMIDGKKTMFMATSELNEELILTKVGDKIKISFEKEEGRLINILEFDNLEIQ